MESEFSLRHVGEGVGVELCWPYRAQQAWKNLSDVKVLPSLKYAVSR